MWVYLLAFALTGLFISRAVHYYRISIPQEARGDISYRPKLRDMDVRYFFWFVLTIFPLFFISAVRYGIGTDYFFTYIPNFYKILQGESPYSEFGFNFLNRFIQLFTDNAQWLIVVTSFIYVFVALRTVIHYSEMPTLSVVVFFVSCIYFAELNNVRQGIAAIILFSAIPYLVNPGYVRFLIAVFLAYLFHQAALIMLIPFLLVNIKFIRNNFLFFAILATLLLPVFCEFAIMLLRPTKYYYYFVSEFNDNRVAKLNIIYHLFFFVFAALELYPRRMQDKYGFVLLLMEFLAFYVSAASIFIRISEMINRIAVFFTVFQLLLIPHMCKVEKRNGGAVAIAGIYILLYSFYLAYSVVLRGGHEVIPYQWIF